MDLATFRRRRQDALAQAPVYRQLCRTCLQPSFSCYCAWLKPFDPGIEFIILIHPIEMHRRVATGRMSHLSLPGSYLIMGHLFNGKPALRRLLEDPSRHCVMLYPGAAATNVTPLSGTERAALIPKGKRLSVIVIDGTWATAKKMVNQSADLKGIRRICFTPSSPSTFRVRRQPRPECYSTIEAIHHTIELLGPVCGFDTAPRLHDSLLESFDRLVNRQLELAHTNLHRPQTTA